MDKIPHVERDPVTDGLTTACAGLWCQFLSEQFDWMGNRSMTEYYKRRSQELSVAPRGAVHDIKLEEAIRVWKR